MKIIGQRELRNDNAVIIRGVESGEEYTVTRRGVPVARLAAAQLAVSHKIGADERAEGPDVVADAS